MKNLYNKGKYRGHEYGKIPKGMKQSGNKLWRRNMVSVISEQLFDERLIRRKGSIHRAKLAKKIILKITTEAFNGRKVSHYVKYKLTKDAQNSLNRNRVLRATLLQTKSFSDHTIIPKSKR